MFASKGYMDSEFDDSNSTRTSVHPVSRLRIHDRAAPAPCLLPNASVGCIATSYGNRLTTTSTTGPYPVILSFGPREPSLRDSTPHASDSVARAHSCGRLLLKSGKYRREITAGTEPMHASASARVRRYACFL